MSRALRSLLLMVLFALVPILAHGQVQTGAPPFGSFGGGPDIINLANLNSHTAVPVLHKPGRGTDFTYDLSYDTSVWTPVGASGSQSWNPALNFGWRGVTEVATGFLSFDAHNVRECKDRSGNVIGVEVSRSNFAYHDTFGTTHPFSGFQILVTGNCGTASGFQSTSISGGGYNLQALANGTFILFDRVGKNINPPINTGGGVGTFTDRNGNQISVNGSGQFFDTLSSSTPVLTVAGAAPSNTTFTYTAPSGANASYTMSYKTYTVRTNFGCSGITEFPATSESLVDRITLPDGTFYQFNYEATPGFSSDVTGRLASVTLPTGGKISYTYTGGNNGIVCADGSVATLTRATPDGTWTYARSIGSGAASTTTITAPKLPYDSAANETVIQFQGIYETQRQVYQGSTSGTLLRTLNTCYNGAASPCTSTAITLPITRRTVLDQIGGTNGPICKHDFLFNTVGVPTEQDDFDYGSGTFGPLLRKILITYASLGNITAFRQTTTVQDGAGHTVAQTTFTYDESTPTGTSGTPQHGAVPGSRGNPTTVSQLVSTGVTLTSHATYYDTGTVNTSTDVNSAVTTFVYGSASCGNAFPTSINEPLSLTRSVTWNCTGGVMATSTDENSKVTTTDWTDADFWRPADAKFPDGGQTSFTYNSATSVTSTTKMNSSQNIVRTVLLDGLGRTKQTQLNSDPQGVDYVDTTYDALGRVQTVSNPHRSTSSATDGITSYQYDALGRTTLVTHPDATTIQTAYAGPATQVSDEGNGSQRVQRISQTDSLGRVTSVCEVSSATLLGNGATPAACGQTIAATGFLTTYQYNALNNLASASQSGLNPRTFVYDGLSRLTSETNPETGTITYAYDASGHFGDLTSRVAPAPNQTGTATVTTTYSYDALHRLTGKSYSDGTPAVTFNYDQSSALGVTLTNTKGRLSSQSTAGAAPTGAVFSYDTLGRIVDNSQCTPQNCGTSVFGFQYPHTTSRETCSRQRTPSALPLITPMTPLLGLPL